MDFHDPSGNLPNERSAAEAMRLIRAWDITRTLLSKDGDHPIGKHIRIPEHSSLRREGFLRDIQVALGITPSDLRSQQTQYTSGTLLNDAQIDDIITQLEAAVKNNLFGRNSATTNALESLREEFVAIREIRTLPLDIPATYPQYESDAKGMLDRETRGDRRGYIAEDRRHPLNANGTTRSNLEISQGVARGFQPPDPAPRLDTTQGDRFVLITDDSKEPYIGSQPMNTAHSGQYTTALSNAEPPIDYVLLGQDDKVYHPGDTLPSKGKVMILIPETSKGFDNIERAMRVLSDVKGKLVSVHGGNAETVIELMTEDPAVAGERLPATQAPDEVSTKAAASVLSTLGKIGKITLRALPVAGAALAIAEVAGLWQEAQASDLTEQQLRKLEAIYTGYVTASAGGLASAGFTEASLIALQQDEDLAPYLPEGIIETIGSLFSNDNTLNTVRKPNGELVTNADMLEELQSFIQAQVHGENIPEHKYVHAQAVYDLAFDKTNDPGLALMIVEANLNQARSGQAQEAFNFNQPIDSYLGRQMSSDIFVPDIGAATMHDILAGFTPQSGLTDGGAPADVGEGYSPSDHHTTASTIASDRGQSYRTQPI